MRRPSPLPILFVLSSSAGPALAAPAEDFFGNPQLLCSALQENGIETGPWKQIAPNSPHAPYFCVFEGPAVAGATVIYRVSGDTGRRADIVSIAVTVHRASASRAARDELHRHVARLFKTIGKPEPGGLFESIERQRYFLSRQPYGIVWFNAVQSDHYKTEDQTLWFRLRQ